ncbi:MAG: hypothetical protein AB1440_27720 [Pseudomonadota bacterium]|jgi:hypothetical protein
MELTAFSVVAAQHVTGKPKRRPERHSDGPQSSHIDFRFEPDRLGGSTGGGHRPRPLTPQIAAAKSRRSCRFNRNTVLIRCIYLLEILYLNIWRT